jgi:hypothetical protein
MHRAFRAHTVWHGRDGCCVSAHRMEWFRGATLLPGHGRRDSRPASPHHQPGPGRTLWQVGGVRAVALDEHGDRDRMRPSGLMSTPNSPCQQLRIHDEQRLDHAGQLGHCSHMRTSVLQREKLTWGAARHGGGNYISQACLLRPSCANRSIM